MTIKQGEMTTKIILSIIGIIALIIGALFLAGSIQRNLFGLSLAYGQPYYDGKTCQQVNQEHSSITQENDFNKRLEESQNSLRNALVVD